MDLRKINLVSRGKLPVYEFLNDSQKKEHRGNYEFTNSSFDEVICIDDADTGYPAVLLIDYDGYTNGRIVNSPSGPEFAPMSKMTHPEADLAQRKRIVDKKILTTAERKIPYLVLPVLAHQRLTDMKEEYLVARFAVIRGLLQAIDLGKLRDTEITTGRREIKLDNRPGIERTYRKLRNLIIPYYDRWEIVLGRIEQISLENRDGETPDYEISMNVVFQETPGHHPNWEHQFSHLTAKTQEITKLQVESRDNITQETLRKETGFGSKWPTLVFQCGPPQSEIYAEFQLDGFQTNIAGEEESLMYEPYLGILASMIIEAGFLGFPVDDSDRVWKLGSLDKFKQ